MKKSLAVIAGIFTGLVSVLFINELFKWLVAGCFVYHPELLFKGIRLSTDFNFAATSFTALVIIIISPLVLSLSLIELSTLFLKTLEEDFYRIMVIIFILINTGYLIFNIILGIFSLLFRSKFVTDWGKLLEVSGYSYNEKLVFMILVMVLLFAYLNFTTKRMRNFIPVINKSKE